MSEKVVPEVVKLDDGREFKKRSVTIRQIAAAEATVRKNEQHLVKYALIAAKLSINGKPAVTEDILDLTEDDFLKVMELWPDTEEDSPNA